MLYRWWFVLVMLVVMVGGSAPGFANPQMEKGIQHFKDFEIQQALTIFLALEKDSSLSAEQRAKASLYAGMSYAYLRKRPEALRHFQKAIQQDSNIQLPKDSPGRLRKLFDEAKQSGGSSSTGGNTPSVPPVEPRREAPPAPQVDPPARTTEPPPRRRFDFGSFSMGRPRPRPQPRATVPDPVDVPPPTRRTTEPSPMLDLPPERRVDTPPPERRRRRVAQTDPVPDTVTPGISRQSQPTRGPNPLWISAWVTAGVAVAMLGVGIAMGSSAASLAGSATEPKTYQVDVPLIEQDANRSALIANVMYIGAGAAAVAAVVLFILHPRGNPKPPRTSGEGLTQLGPQTPSPVPAPPHARAFSLYTTP